MTLRYFYMDPDAVAVELTDRIWTALEWHSSAEEVNAVQSEWVIEDPDSDLLLYPWRRVYVLDDEAPTDHTVIGMGSIADIHIRRSEVYPRTATCRAWHLTITDLNYEPQRWLFEEADSPDRPAETDLERVAWYLGTDEALHLGNNLDYIDTTGGVSLDALDLTTQSPADLLRGAMDQSGRNAFIGYDESKGPPDFDTADNGELFLFYGLPGSDFWTSDLTLSNDPAEIDPSNGIYPLAEDDLDLQLDPTRVNSRLHVAYDGGLVTVQDSTIADVYTRRETTLDASDLTDPTKASSRGTRMLQQGRVPENRVEWGYHCQSDDVNSLLAGQLFTYKATHLGGLEELGAPDYAAGAQVRAMDRTVVEKSQGNYYVSGSAVPTGLVSACDSEYAATASGFYPPLNGEVTDSDAVVYYGSVGDPTPEVPTPGHNGGWPFPAYGTGGSPDYAGDCATAKIVCIVVGSGTIAVETAQYTQPRNLTASLLHRNPGDPNLTIDSVQTGVAGDTFTFDVSTHGGANCVHIVNVAETGDSGCGDKFGFAGATWTSTETP
jgi:hypothetical protein